jgi:hypothetical protein
VSEQDALPLENEPEEKPKVEISQEDLDALKARADELETRLQASEIDKARLEEQAKAPVAPAAPTTPPPPTREQLQEAVDGGTISQAQMDTELARQMRVELQTDIETKLRAEFTAADQLKAITSQFDAYMKMKPDVAREGTEDRLKIQKEFQALVDLGYPANEKRTELLAMRNVFGPLDRIKETTRERLPVTQETGGAGGASAGGKGSGWREGLTSGQVEAFEHQQKIGVYPSETDKTFLAVVTRARTSNLERKAS